MNYARRPVTLLGGPALAASATPRPSALGAPRRHPRGRRSSSARSPAWSAATTTSPAPGPSRPGTRAWPVTSRRCGQGRVSAGAVKVAGIGAAAAVAALLTRRGGRGCRRWSTASSTTGLVAGTANLVNLLDLRPGRAGEGGRAASPPRPSAARRAALVAGPLGATFAVLPEDLGERVMLGDCGANALGALLGLRLASIPGRGPRAALLAGVVALTLASEKVSFTKVIEATPGLRELDRLGRRPA